jgi:hypothetical protein
VAVSLSGGERQLAGLGMTCRIASREPARAPRDAPTRTGGSDDAGWAEELHGVCDAGVNAPPQRVTCRPDRPPGRCFERDADRSQRWGRHQAGCGPGSGAAGAGAESEARARGWWRTTMVPGGGQDGSGSHPAKFRGAVPWTTASDGGAVQFDGRTRVPGQRSPISTPSARTSR